MGREITLRKNFFTETLYDRLRGKEPLGNLQPLPAPDPGMIASGPDPTYTPRKPLNEFATRIIKRFKHE